MKKVLRSGEDVKARKESWPFRLMKCFHSCRDSMPIQRLMCTLSGYNRKDRGKIIFEH